MSLSNTAAFPFKYTDVSNVTHIFTGITVRQYFAAKAMQGLLAQDAAPIAEIAIDAVAMANALLAELEKSKCAT